MRAGYTRITRRVACSRFGAGDDFKVRGGVCTRFRKNFSGNFFRERFLNFEEICIREIIRKA